MTLKRNHRFSPLALLPLMMVALIGIGGCSTAPKQEDTKVFVSEARAATMWFERNVSGLSEQIDNSAGYIVFPAVGQWGILIGGGTYGRGMLNRPNDSQIGWAAINTGSIGLQAGVQGFKMLIVLQDAATVRRFMDNQLAGGVSAVAVAAESGGSAKTPFKDGVAVYQGANTGLMAGVNIGLDYIRYEPLGGGS